MHCEAGGALPRRAAIVRPPSRGGGGGRLLGRGLLLHRSRLLDDRLDERHPRLQLQEDLDGGLGLGEVDRGFVGLGRGRLELQLVRLRLGLGCLQRDLRLLFGLKSRAQRGLALGEDHLGALESRPALVHLGLALCLAALHGGELLGKRGDLAHQLSLELIQDQHVEIPAFRCGLAERGLCGEQELGLEAALCGELQQGLDGRLQVLAGAGLDLRERAVQRLLKGDLLRGGVVVGAVAMVLFRGRIVEGGLRGCLLAGGLLKGVFGNGGCLCLRSDGRLGIFHGYVLNRLHALHLGQLRYALLEKDLLFLGHTVQDLFGHLDHLLLRGVPLVLEQRQGARQRAHEHRHDTLREALGAGHGLAHLLDLGGDRVLPRGRGPLGSRGGAGGGGALHRGHRAPALWMGRTNSWQGTVSGRSSASWTGR
mmetsp:Transcript_90094/g.234853  ORF Transcript_90094/g.234853 Transcript_90094/m.234853 type:complete len:424 (-) Transcript_90094:11-1282(-)